MALIPEDVTPFLPALESFAHRYGYALRFVEYDGDQYYSVSWITSHGWAAYLTLRPKGHTTEVAGAYALGAHCLTFPHVTSKRKGVSLGVFTSGVDAATFTSQLEAGRDWAESLLAGEGE